MDKEDIVCIYVCTCIYTHACIHAYTLTHSVGYYSSIKTEMLLFSVTWIDLEGIMLSERS